MDWQKGLDRLAVIIGRSAPPEPPAFEPAALDALYAWADVLVLPSRFEGVPLVVLEARRMGCAVLATDAGETAEVVAHGEDGVLLPQSGRPEAALVADFLAHLLRLAAEPGPLLEVGRRAAARVAAAGGGGGTKGG